MRLAKLPTHDGTKPSTSVEPTTRGLRKECCRLLFWLEQAGALPLCVLAVVVVIGFGTCIHVPFARFGSTWLGRHVRSSKDGVLRTKGRPVALAMHIFVVDEPVNEEIHQALFPSRLHEIRQYKLLEQAVSFNEFPWWDYAAPHTELQSRKSTCVVGLGRKIAPRFYCRKFYEQIGYPCWTFPEITQIKLQDKNPVGVFGFLELPILGTNPGTFRDTKRPLRYVGAFLCRCGTHFSNISLMANTSKLEKSYDHIGNRDVDDGPARRWRPPTFVIGLILFAGGFALISYGAKRFYDCGLDRRIWQLWWLPIVYLVIILSLRVMVYGF